jgi:homoserine kinase
MGHDKNGWVRVFAPASVANVGCGFDIFGFPIENLGDIVAARRREEPGVALIAIEGDDGRLPSTAEKNTAGVSALWLLRRVAETTGEAQPGVELRLEKGMPLASGLGSSAASAVAGAVAVDALLGLNMPRETLLAAAVEGERIVCGCAHADNVAASLYGGFVLVRNGQDPEVVQLPVPPGLACAVVRPHVEIETGAARALLGKEVALAAAVVQWGNVGAMVAGLFRGDHELLRSALHDAVAEPVRSLQVPGFQAMKEAALAAGALGCSLSGSGPSTFALCGDRAGAEAAGEAMAAAFHGATGKSYDLLISPVGAPGACVL